MDTLISVTLWNVVLLAGLRALQPFVRVIKSGPKYAISNFDKRVEEGVFARRLAMVGSNQTEALVLWATVVFVAALAVPNFLHPHTWQIAAVFLTARLVYAAVSLAGIPLLRSVAWIVGLAAWAYLTWITVTAIAL